jgi:tRNA(Ile)-lysidine synthase
LELVNESTNSPIAMPLRARVRRTIQRYALVARGQRVAIALSGGADSVALLHLARELEADGDLVIAGAAHLNHQLRGAEADEDERFCADLAARLQVPIEIERADVRAAARRDKRSIEDAARRVRYAFLERAADRFGADVIFVAHTRDDQAETFLLRLVRGAATRGLAGIRPRAGRVVRPLIELGRSELRAYLSERHIAFREDSSNRDLSNPRNRVRHELIPYLESHFSPSVAAVLAREAELARIDEEALHAEAIKIAGRIVLTDEGDRGALRLDASALRSVEPALASRVAREALARYAGDRFISSDHVQRLLALAVAIAQGQDEDGGGAGDRAAVDLPGQRAVRVGPVITLTPAGAPRGRRSQRRAPNSFSVSLSIPGEVRLDRQGWAIAAEQLDAMDAGPRTWSARGPLVGVAAGSLALPLVVRSRRPGDRFRPIGAPGVRKLQDFLVDRKVPREERDGLPIVVDGRDRIVWVAGQAVAEDFRVTDPSQGVLLLTIRRLGGSG